jgi:peptidoglycan/LPS O-acetylase OafA/YrhL
VSYSLYMTHPLAVSVSGRLITRLFHEKGEFSLSFSPVQGLTALLLQIGISVGSSWLVFYSIEEPCRKLFRKRIAFGRTPPAVRP